MDTLNIDLHIHSRHSISVSKNMTIPRIAQCAQEKGIDVVGTGDATQPDWLEHIKKSLKVRDGVLRYEDTDFILTTEIEDNDSVHHVIILPIFEAIDQLRTLLKPHSPNLDHRWGGRPRVNLDGEHLAGLVRDVGGLIGPAHAFTPFRSIFRENKYNSLKECYGTESDNIHFIELGLSADTETADYIPELRHLTFITSSDAHSPSPAKIGREFVRFRLADGSFSELRKAILRENNRGPVLNVGLNPKLGKYYLSFCSSCRRTLVLEDGDNAPEYDDLNIYISCNTPEDKTQLVNSIHRRKVSCPADGKHLRLGVRDRAMMLGEGFSKSPKHRPPYLYIPPLLDLISDAHCIKSKSSKKVRAIYDTLRKSLGDEIIILTSGEIREIASIDASVSRMIKAFRDGTVKYVPGGGGRYGHLVLPWSDEVE